MLPIFVMLAVGLVLGYDYLGPALVIGFVAGFAQNVLASDLYDQCGRLAEDIVDVTIYDGGDRRNTLAALDDVPGKLSKLVFALRTAGLCKIVDHLDHSTFVPSARISARRAARRATLAR